VSIPTIKIADFNMNKFRSIKEVLPECFLSLTLLERVDLFGKFLKFKLDLGSFLPILGCLLKAIGGFIRISTILLGFFRAKQVKN
jgi:hypothetical protein